MDLQPQEPPPSKPPRTRCSQVIEEVEEYISRGDITSALGTIEVFFLSIAPEADPTAAAAAFASRSRYPELMYSEIPDGLKIAPERRADLERFAASIHATPTITCSVFMENVLVRILENSSGPNLDTCIKLIFYVMKERYDEFMAWVGARGNDGIRMGEGVSEAMNNFGSFMHLTRALIMKKIDTSVLEEQRGILHIVDITFFISRMYDAIYSILHKIYRDGGSNGIDIERVREWYGQCRDLDRRFQQNIANEMGSAVKRDDYDKLNEKLLTFQRETKVLIDHIAETERRLASRSQPGTPERQGGRGGKRIKTNYSKTKKYKKNNSKSKKYKKNNSKSKKYKKKFY